MKIILQVRGKLLLSDANYHSGILPPLVVLGKPLQLLPNCKRRRLLKNYRIYSELRVQNHKWLFVTVACDVSKIFIFIFFTVLILS